MKPSNSPVFWDERKINMRVRILLLTLTAIFGLAAVLLPGGVEANHPVLVEGNCFGPGMAQRTMVTPGTCGDYDGDGRIGTAEDTDEADRVFGTINAALGPGTGAAAGTGANQNGRVIIVASGSFAEVVNITGANGNVQLEGAPGVDANIDAIVQGVAGGAARQAAPGIIVNAPQNRHVTIRNIVSRNWAVGIQVVGQSHVLIDSCRIENNVNHGVLVQDDARVKINETDVTATGFRVGGGTDFPAANLPSPGVGIEYQGNSSGLVCNTCVSRSFGAGIKNSTERKRKLALKDVCLFDNRPNRDGFAGGRDRDEDRDRD